MSDGRAGAGHHPDLQGKEQKLMTQQAAPTSMRAPGAASVKLQMEKL